MKTKFALAIFTAIFLYSCADTLTNKRILGNWQAVSWVSNGGTALDRNVATTQFSFDSTGNYRFVNNGNVEKGTYKVELNNLFTTASGKQEIMVKITKATTDTLVFDMNNGGQKETITLLKIP